MGTQERLLRWQPDISLPRNLDTPALTSNSEQGLQLILAEPTATGRAFRVQFENPLAFRSANESYRLKLLEAIGDLPWPTFKVEDSEWVEWFHEQTHGIHRDWLVQHYIFLGEDIVEVLSTVEPQFAEIERTSTYGWR